jgi:transposase
MFLLSMASDEDPSWVSRSPAGFRSDPLSREEPRKFNENRDRPAIGCHHRRTVTSFTAVHRVTAFAEVIEAAGAIPLFLPPYSPDLNPIEQTSAD